MQRYSVILLALTLIGCAPVATSPVTDLSAAPTGRIWFATQDYNSLADMLYRSDMEASSGLAEFLADAPPKARHRIFGDLYLPDAADGRVPVIVLFHGGAGPNGPSADWYSRRFREQGWGIFVVNNVAGRGFSRWSREGDRFYTSAAISAAYLADAINALRTLGQHPQIDPGRIAILGQSYGGAASLYSNFENLVSGLLPEGLRYRAHASVYGVCFNWVWSARSSGSPVAMLAGQFDDWTGTRADLCEHHAKYLASRSFDVRFRVVPGYHGWDQLNSSNTGSMTGGSSSVVNFAVIDNPPPRPFGAPEPGALVPRAFPARTPQLWVRGDMGVTQDTTAYLIQFFKEAFAEP